MGRLTSRAIVVDDTPFRWRVTHRYPSTASNPRVCQERFLAYREGTSGCALEVCFSGGAIQAGYPESGVVWLFGPHITDFVSVNLNRPAVAVALIRLAQARGWQPGQTSLVIEADEALVRELTAIVPSLSS